MGIRQALGRWIMGKNPPRPIESEEAREMAARRWNGGMGTKQGNNILEQLKELEEYRSSIIKAELARREEMKAEVRSLMEEMAPPYDDDEPQQDPMDRMGMELLNKAFEQMSSASSPPPSSQNQAPRAASPPDIPANVLAGLKSGIISRKDAITWAEQRGYSKAEAEAFLDSLK